MYNKSYRPKPKSISVDSIPAVIKRAGNQAQMKFIDFFTDSIQNKNTHRAYAEAIRQFFEWCDLRQLEIHQIAPLNVDEYFQHQQKSKSTIRLHLAAVKKLFDYLVLGQIISVNPAISIHGPKYDEEIKTPVLTAEQILTLLDSISTNKLIDLRDRAIIGVLIFAFARVSGVTSMKVGDYYKTETNWIIRLHEDSGKVYEILAHHLAREFLDSYIEAMKLWNHIDKPLFQPIRHEKPTCKFLAPVDIYKMLQRRVNVAGIECKVCCNTFRATGITTYLYNKGSFDIAQAMANHKSPRSTMLYYKRMREITLNEVERIRI